MPTSTIVAIGGGGFDSDAPHRAQLDRFLLDRTGATNPRVCLIPTASGDSLFRTARFLRACATAGASPTLLELFRLERDDFDNIFAEQDLIFISGGNTYNMLALWRLWGLDKALHTAWENGVLIAGVSAGANCWFENCSTDSFPNHLEVIEAMGWLEGGFCPHYDEEPTRRSTTHNFVNSGRQTEVLAADGGVGCVFEGTRLVEVVSCHKEATAYKVSGNPAAETRLEARKLLAL